jgi:hypothetical protein
MFVCVAAIGLATAAPVFSQDTSSASSMGAPSSAEASSSSAEPISSMAPTSSESSSSVAPDVAEPLPADWQEAITGQVQAFRDHNAAVALSFAAAPFHEQYSDPEQFYTVIIGSGYAPIATSRSHSFGAYRVLAPNVVLQEVKFIGNDQRLFQALYQLTKEADGWRVSGVQLVQQSGVAV